MQNLLSLKSNLFPWEESYITKNAEQSPISIPPGAKTLPYALSLCCRSLWFSGRKHISKDICEHGANTFVKTEEELPQRSDSYGKHRFLPFLDNKLACSQAVTGHTTAFQVKGCHFPLTSILFHSLALVP